MTDKAAVFRKYVFDEMSKFRQPEHLRNFIESLDDGQIETLCDWLSAWRNNEMHRFIGQSPREWKIADVPISKIKVGDVNEIVKPMLKRNRYRLDAIAADPEIGNHFEFAWPHKYQPGELIAVKQGNMYLLKDGIHRAIRAACDGTTEFRLMYY
ncbi:MAG: hypothetical protein WD750_06020 [Gammaproteobacteria bacterium]